MKASVTPRGRAFVAAALGVLAVVVLLGERDLLPAAVLLAAIPLLGFILVRTRRFSIGAVRLLHPPQVTAGMPVQVTLSLTNLAGRRSGLLLLSEQLPAALGGARHRFTVEDLAAETTTTTSYVVTPTHRGRYPVGPLHLWSTDPMGVAVVHRTFRSVHQLLVTPPVIPLVTASLPGSSPAGDSEARASRRSHTIGEPETSVRPYQQGDDVRKVHWRATASAGELMVRQEIRRPNATAVIVLDTRASAHRGSGPNSSFEWAVTAAASIGTLLRHQGYQVVLHTSSDMADSAEELLPRLATVKLASAREILPKDVHATAAELVIAVTGLLDPHASDGLIAFAPRRGLAIVLDASTWTKPPVGETSDAVAAAEQLASHRWTATVARLGDPLAEVWRNLNRTAVAR